MILPYKVEKLCKTKKKCYKTIFLKEKMIQDAGYFREWERDKKREEQSMTL